MPHQQASLTAAQKIIFALYFLPLISAFVAVDTDIFFFKAAVAGSCILILALFFSASKTRDRNIAYIFAAFAFSIAGDWFLSNKGENFFMFAAGIGLFFIAHVGYLGYALNNGKPRRVFTIVLLACYLLFFFCALYPAIENSLLLGATFIYLLISCISLGAAAGMTLPPASTRLYFFAIALILFSDTLIAFNEFLDYNTLNDLILPTYYAAQIGVTLAVMLTAVLKSK